MFRLLGGNFFLRRLLHGGTVYHDQVVEQIRACSAEDQLFDVLGKNKDTLEVNHISGAVEMLWKFQKSETDIPRTNKLTRSHPEFLILRVLAENKIALMDDNALVDILYNFHRLNVDPHASVVQQLVSEAWRRIDKLSMYSLSKFAICLSDHKLHHSPLMGHITSIVDQRLSSIDDIRTLTTLMISISYLVSPRLRDALLSRVKHLFETVSPKDSGSAERVVQFMCQIKHSHHPLLKKCNEIILYNIPKMNADKITLISQNFQAVKFYNFDFTLAVRQRLTELIDSSTDPFSFTDLFVTLAPIVSEEIRDGLENTVLLLADELNPKQALAIVEALEENGSRDAILLNKLSSVIQSNLRVYDPVEVGRITQALILLQYSNPDHLIRLRGSLVNFLQHRPYPSEVAPLVHVLLSMRPYQQLEECVLERLDEWLSQCKLGDIATIGSNISHQLRKDSLKHSYTPSRYVPLLQNLHRCGVERLQTADRLDRLLEEIKYPLGEWFEEMLLEEMIVTLKRMTDQITWTIVPELAQFFVRVNYLCPPLMERIASVVIKDIDKFDLSEIYATLLSFSYLNYDPVQTDKLFDICIQSVTPQISSCEPHLLVLLGYCLAMAGYFPEELIREIFNIDFLGKLDSQLETLPNYLKMHTRMRLMRFNRAVCLECPEFQVPWFHEEFCQQPFINEMSRQRLNEQQEIYKIIGEALGSTDRVRVAVTTPYSYAIDFECILDKHMQPLPYSELRTLQTSDKEEDFWGKKKMENIRDELPPGAQRVAVEFLSSKCFSNNHHMKREFMMKKRHLEILGYRVVQIPHFQWNSMEFSTLEAWKEFLKKSIFGEVSS